MAFNRGQRLLNGMINMLPGFFMLLGVFGGLWAGIYQYCTGSTVINEWFASNGGWEMSSFSAFGTMSGFGMAALALIATLSTHERGKEAIDSNSGRLMVRLIIRSTWAWLIPGLVALLHMLMQDAVIRAIFIGVSWFAVCQGVLALLGLTFFFRRFTVNRQ